MGKKIIAIVIIGFVVALGSFAQDFGFGSFDSDDAPAQEKILSNFKPVASVESLTFSFFDTSKTQGIGVSASGMLGFDYVGNSADGKLVFDFDLYPDYDFALDEAWIHSFLGRADIKAGFLRHTWGKADSEGPLDVINPVRLTDLSITDLDKRKISQPALILGWSITPFTRIEIAATPWFEADKIAIDGPWAPAQMRDMMAQMEMLKPLIGSGIQVSGDMTTPETNSLDYFQAGARLTTTIASHDLGFQYWYGNMRTPTIALSAKFAAPPMPPLPPIPTAITSSVSYDRYHLIGLDWASVLFGLNLRAELASLLTEDFAGDDPAIANPQIKWSFGFDRDLIANINLNMQASGLVRLMHNKINDDPLVPMAGAIPAMADLAQIPVDFESKQEKTDTQIMVRLSRSFFRDELELNLTGLKGIESKDFYLMPEIKLVKEEVSTNLSAGFFFGDKDGNLGQFYKNNWIRLSLKYEL